MKKILYLHGLESTQGGQKVDFLAENNFVYAPKINYANPNEFNRIKSEVQIIKPDLIIGSSMGGYFGFLFGSLINVNILLFNPALHSRSVQIENAIGGKLPVVGSVILGELDLIIHPNITIQILKNHPNLKIKTIPGIQHQIPFEIFKQEVSLYL